MLASVPSWLDIADAAAILTLLVFGVGLWWVSQLYEKIGASIAEGNNGVMNMSAVTNIMQSYRFMYLTMAW